MNGGAAVGAILAVMVMMSGTPQALPAANPCGDGRALLAVRKPRQHDVSRTVGASAMMQTLKDRGETLIVDVREAGEFARFRIPGSINVPLHFVKTKPFLKTKPFILVDEGCGHLFLAEECGKLVDAGFPCSVLYGGLTAWRDEGGPLEGDYTAENKLGTITAAMFSREKDGDGWLVVDVSKQRNPLSICLMPDAVSVPLSGAPARVASSLRDAGRPRPGSPFARILIFNEDGFGYDSIRVLAGKAGLKSVFFLQGGLERYVAYLGRQTLQAMPRGERLKTTDGCGGGCGGKR